ncbi:adenylyltransferase/cytidyltransferase family protein [Candidatus Woesebacteria bacterium]|nr:adenylyltransferase/cytidyltransferase family protein [Candidatus Woesebacteria bacterium]
MKKSVIVSQYSELPPLVAAIRKKGKTLVLTQGTFDMLHIGHARYLELAKSHGDVLFVGVDSDAKVRARKGPDRPVVPEEERTEMLTYLTSVDYVVLKPEITPKWELIKIIRPDVLIATDQTYTAQELRELKKICGTVIVVEPMATTSTSAKIRRVQIGAAKKMSTALSTKLIKAIEDALEELK